MTKHFKTNVHLKGHIIMKPPKNKAPIQPASDLFIDPCTDFGFNYLFGSDPSKELLIHFLNQLLEGERKIHDLQFKKTEFLPRSLAEQTGIVDLQFTGIGGEEFILEMHRFPQKYFKKRCAFHVSRLIEEAVSLKGGNWNFNPPPIYFIGILDFCLEGSDPNDWLQYRRSIFNWNVDAPCGDDINFIFLELPKFHLSESELRSDLDKWGFVFKNLRTLQKIPVVLRGGIFGKLLQRAAVAKLSKNEYRRYTKSQSAKWDAYAVGETAKEEGIKIGEEKKKQEMLKRLVLSGEVPLSTISKIYGVDIDCLKELTHS